MNKRDLITELYADTEDVLFADGFDEAIIGFDSSLWKVIYSKGRAIDILVSEEGMSEEEAVDFAEYNTFSAYVGEKTPLWVEDFSWSESDS